MKLSLAAFALCVVAPAAVAAQSGPPPSLPDAVLHEDIDAAKVSYLKAHVVTEGAVAGPFDFAFPADFYGNRLFLVGESHGWAATHVFDLALLEHLARRIGVRDYVGEFDPIQAEAFNHYLTTGDDAALKRVFDSWLKSGAQWGSKAYEAKIRGVRALNARLGKSHTISFHGLDQIQDWPMTLEWLQANGKFIIKAMFDKADSDSARASYILSTLPKVSRGESRTLTALRSTLAFMASGLKREPTIAASFNALANGELGRRPAYGMWGLFHTVRESVNKGMPFAALVQHGQTRFAGHVASIPLVPIDSHALMYVPGKEGLTPMRLNMFNVAGPVAKLDGSADLVAAAPAAQVTVYDLGARGSPYLSGSDLVAVKTSIGQDITPTDPAVPSVKYAQFVGVVRGLTGLSPDKEIGRFGVKTERL